MKKTIRGIILILSVVFLTACGNTSYHEKLQKKDWQVVSSSGESYTAKFASDTVSFSTNIFSLGFNYEIKEDNIIKLKETDDNDDVRTFEISEKAEDELFFEAQDEETLEATGNLTLSPLEKNNE